VIHRDLKPANVLVDAQGVLRVIDFGIARLESASEASQLTTAGEVIGTLQSMAPEQLRGEEIDTRADIYALGVLLYELASGVLPHDLAGKPAPLAYRLLAEEAPPPPSSRKPGLPVELDWIVARAMERERERRYASAAALEEDVLRLERHEPPLARATGAWYRLGKYARRHRAGVAAALAVGILSLAMLATWIVGATRAAREHQRARVGEARASGGALRDRAPRPCSRRELPAQPQRPLRAARQRPGVARGSRRGPAPLRRARRRQNAALPEPAAAGPRRATREGSTWSRAWMQHQGAGAQAS
jgi:hypothetical protein